VWALLSTRLRTWLLLVVAIPLIRRAIRTAANRLSRRDPNRRSARALRTVDGALARLDRRRTKQESNPS
jgi:hypothetical protein